MKYKISIIMPIYNAEKYIEKAVESLFNQDMESIEYIFINDCSTDNTLEKLEKLIRKYDHLREHIRIYSNPINRGLGFTRKKGLEFANGTYTLQIDSDDWIELNMCSDLYAVAEKFNADIVTSDYYMNYPNKQLKVLQLYDEDSKKDFINILTEGVHGSVCNKLIKTSLYKNNNIYPPEDFSLFEDKITTLQLFYAANVVKHVPKPYLHYRQAPNSMTKSLGTDRHVEDNIKFIKTLDKFFTDKQLHETFGDEFRTCVLYHKKIFLLNKKYTGMWDTFYPEVNKIKYLRKIKSYDFKKKIVTLLAMYINKNIMLNSYKIAQTLKFHRN